MIRALKLEDVPDLVKMVDDCHKESYYSKYEFNKDLVIEHFVAALRQQEVHCLVSVKANQLRGFILLAKANPFFSTDFFMHNLLVYVKPEFRTSTDFLYLVRESEKLAKELGCVEFMIGTSSEINTDKFKAVAEKMGYEKHTEDLRKDLR